MHFRFFRKIFAALCMCMVLFFSSFPAGFSFVADAAINPQINYQGKLLGTTGSAVSDGTYEMTFKLYTVSSGGSAIWTEARTSGDEVTVESGLFSVMLGEVSSLSGVDFNQPLWLGVTVESDSEMTPRKPVGTVPAAFVAESANTFGSATSTQYLRSDIASIFSVSTTGTGLIINQSGTGDILNLQDGGSEVFTVTDGGNVGIGTTNPGQKLHVNGESRIENGYIVLDKDYGFVLDGYNVGARNPIWTITKDYPNYGFSYFEGTPDYIGFHLSNDPNNNDFTISGDGHGVFRGTVSATGGNSTNWNTAYGWGNHASAGYLLSTSIDTSSELAGILTNETGSGSLVFGTSPTFTTNANFFGDTISDFTGTGLVLSGSTLTVATSSLGITSSQWTTSGSDIYYNASGNVGIGTASPTELLTVGSSGYFTINDNGLVVAGVGDSSTPSYGFSVGGTGMYFDGTSLGISYLGSGLLYANEFGAETLFDAYGSQTLAINSVGGGSVGIGTTTPDERLTVGGGISFAGALRVSGNVGSSGQILQSTGSVAQWVSTSTLGIVSSQWSTNGTSVYYSGGNVGIGTSTPGAKLHVLGTSDQMRVGYDASNYFTSVVGSTGLVTFDATGSGSSFHFNDTISTDGLVRLDGSAGNDYIWHSGSNKVNIATAGFDRLTVDGSGNVGIGTSTPGAKLHVDDATSSVLRVSSGSRRISLAAVAADTNYLSSVGASLRLLSSDSDVQVWSNGAVHTYFNVSGQLLMAGTSSAAAPGLSTYAYNTSGMFFPSTGNLGFSTAGTERVRIDGSGNVGIGTSTPDTKLQVSGGGIKLDNNQKLIWRNAAGTANQNVLYLDSLNNTVLTSGSNAIALYNGSSAHTLDVYNAATVANRLNAGGVSYVNGGDFVVGGTSSLGRFTVYGTSTSQVSQMIRMASGQTADSLVVEDSAGNDLLRHWTASGLGSVLRVMSTSTKYFQMESYAADNNYFSAAGAPFTVRTVGGAYNINFFTNTTDQRMAISASTGHLIVGSTATNGNARVHSIWNSGAQLRLGYDTSNTAYMDATTGSTGITTFNAVGSAASFAFSDAVSVSAASGSSTIARLLATGTSIPARLELLGTNSSASQSAQTFVEASSTASSDAALNFYTRKSGDSFNAPGLAASINQDSVYFKGNVGIGTTTPGMKLDIHSGAGGTAPTIRQTFTDATSFAEWNILEGSTFKGGLAVVGSNFSTALWRDSLLLTAATNNTGSFIFRTRTSSAYAERLIITNAGNVGIGTTTPSTILQVHAGTTNTPNGLTLTQGGGNSGRIFFYGGTAGAGHSIYQAFGTLLINTGATPGVTSGAAAMAIGATGNVGIGTTTPTSKLAVSSDQHTTLSIDTTTSSNSTRLYFTENASVKGAIMGAGSAFATTDRQNDLELFSYSGDMTFWPGGTQAVTFKSGGNVGIGTTTPGDLLTVAGSINLTGALKTNGSAGTSGYLLQTTGSGVQWVATSTLGIGGSSQWTTSGSDIYYDTGAVSIGTTSPESQSSLTIVKDATGDSVDSKGVYVDISHNGFESSTNAGYFSATAESAYVTATGVMGIATPYTSMSSGYGVYGAVYGNTGAGVSGTSYGDASGVTGNTSSASGYGVYGSNSASGGIGVYGYGATGGYGIYGSSGSTSGTGVYGFGHYGFYGLSNNSTGRAAYFSQLNSAGHALYVTGGKNYIQNNLGIGTSSPTDLLSVAGNMNLTGALKANGSAGTSGYLLQTTGTGVQWVATSSLGIASGSGTVNSGTATQVAFYNSSGTAVSGTSAIAITASGDVHIGTTTALVANVDFYGYNLKGGGDGMFSIKGARDISPGAAYAGLSFQTTDGTTGRTRMQFTRDYIRFYGANNEVETMRLAGANLGIGTTTPDEMLTVAGNINLTGALKTNGSAGTSGYLLQTTGTGVQWVATSTLGISGGGGSSQWTTSGSDIYYNTGKVGVGTTTPYSDSRFSVEHSVVGNSNSAAIRGHSYVNSGDFSGNSYGGYFSAAGADHGLSIGVYGYGDISSANYAYGVWGNSEGIGVYGSSSGGTGIQGSGFTGVYGSSNNASGKAGHFSQSNAAGYSLYAAGGVNYIQNNLGLGVTSASARLHVVSTTEQLRAGYDASNYLAVTVASDGNINFTAAGSDPEFAFMSNIGINTASPATELDIYGANGGAGNIYLMRNDSTTVTDDELGGIAFGSSDGPSPNAASINAYASENYSSSNAGSYLTFKTSQTGGDTISERMRITDAGNVGIGTTTPQRRLHVRTTADEAPVRFEDSSGYCEINPISTTWSCTSDERLKENIRDLIMPQNASSTSDHTALELIADLRPVTFSWKNDETHGDRTGLIAQEVERIFPDLVNTDEAGFKSVSYGGFTVYLISAMKELIARLETVEEALASLTGEAMAGVTSVVERFTVGSSDKPTGITLYDEETGEPYCLKVKGGETRTTPGECEVVDRTQPQNPAPENPGPENPEPVNPGDGSGTGEEQPGDGEQPGGEEAGEDTGGDGDATGGTDQQGSGVPDAGNTGNSGSDQQDSGSAGDSAGGDGQSTGGSVSDGGNDSGAGESSGSAAGSSASGSSDAGDTGSASGDSSSGDSSSRASSSGDSGGSSGGEGGSAGAL